MRLSFKLLICCTMFTVQIKASLTDHFVTTWKTDNQGNSSNTSITIPTKPSETYNYDVDWDNDGIFDELGITGDATHDFGVAGTYTVRIQGLFPRIYFASSGEQKKILSVDQWGTNTWNSFALAFYTCENLEILATDSPDLSQLTDMSFAFYSCLALNQSLANWDVSNVQDMQGTFSNARGFNQDISAWDVSSVTNMSEMFRTADTFNMPLNNWDVSNVEDMSYMFMQAPVFDQPLNTWSVSNVNDMKFMFYGASNFNRPLVDWDVSNVTDMSLMFFFAISFNGDLANWSPSSVTNMEKMFSNASSFNSPIGDWDVSNVEDFSYMFEKTPFNQPIGSWNLGSATSLRNMFLFNTDFNQNVGSWDVSGVVNMAGTFRNARSFDQDLSAWDVSLVKRMENMFRNSDVFNQDLSSWNTVKVENMSGMFRQALAFDQNVGSWNIEKVSNCSGMFLDSELSDSNYDSLLIGWSTQNVKQGVSLSVNSSYCYGYQGRSILVEDNGWVILDNGLKQDCGFICPVSDSAPVDLSKSFQPVNGVYDRVQLKWYKSSPQVKYQVADSAACEIRYTAVKDLITNTQIQDQVTYYIPRSKVFKTNGPLFKWPLKYTRQGMLPNTRYQWAVRCFCDFGDGLSSDWSATKQLDTPDFDPVTGIFTPPGIQEEGSKDGSKANVLEDQAIHIYPNPASEWISIRTNSINSMVEIFDSRSKSVRRIQLSSSKEVIRLDDMAPGIYFLRLST
ncbi:MAG: BspA family leucine-rich repeat surface protein, partial [Flavobacteriales bacterium]|nr:BspA family leucine-rich repeat surface protein [Flavobacteriales bacterium]